MKAKNLRRLMRSYSTGAPGRRLRKAKEAYTTYALDAKRLRNSLYQQEVEYTRTREAWESTRINGLLHPQEIDHQVREGQLMGYAAWVLMIGELGAFWVIASNFDVSPYFFLILAIILTFAAKASLIAILNKPLQPVESKRRFRLYAIIPAAAMVLMAGVVLLFSRAAQGEWALTMEVLINIALFLLSFGCLGLSAGLFATSYLLSWSRRAERKYRATEDELMLTVREGHKVTDIIRSLEGGNNDQLSQMGLTKGAI
jgi:hypothetical protein